MVVVAQTLYTSTMEHIKEFATVKAIGGGNAEIYGIIAKQAAIAAVAGFALGAAMAYGLRPLMAAIDLKLILTPTFSVYVFVGTLALASGPPRSRSEGWHRSTRPWSSGADAACEIFRPSRPRSRTECAASLGRQILPGVNR